MNISPAARRAAALGCAALCVGCLAALAGGTRETGYSYWWAVALAALCAAGARWFSLTDRRERRCFGALGALLAGAQALGMRLESAGYSGVPALLLCLGAAAGAGPAVGYVLERAWRALCALKPAAGKNGRADAWGYAALIFVAWLPVLPAHWPGNLRL